MLATLVEKLAVTTKQAITDSDQSHINQVSSQFNWPQFNPQVTPHTYQASNPSKQQQNFVNNPISNQPKPYVP